MLSPALGAFSILLCAFSILPASRAQEDVLLTVKITTTISSNGSGTIEEETLFSKAALDWMNSLGGQTFSGDEMCTQFITGMEDTATSTQEERSDGTACITKQSFADLDELKSRTAKIASDVSYKRLEITDGVLYYDVMPNSENAADFGGILPIQIKAYWILKVPGEVVKTNADTVDGRILTWDLMKITESSHLTAESKIGGGPLGLDPTLMTVGAVVLLLCCCVVLLIAAGAGFYFLRRKK